jgi:hypothetical protein
MSAESLSPLVRYGIGFVSALIPAAIALAFLDGTMQLLVLGIAVLDFVVTPQILKHAN